MVETRWWHLLLALVVSAVGAVLVYLGGSKKEPVEGLVEQAQYASSFEHLWVLGMILFITGLVWFAEGLKEIY